MEYVAGANRSRDSLIVALFLMNLSKAFLKLFVLLHFQIPLGELFHMLTTLLLKKFSLALTFVSWLNNLWFKPLTLVVGPSMFPLTDCPTGWYQFILFSPLLNLNSWIASPLSRRSFLMWSDSIVSISLRSSDLWDRSAV